MDLLHKEQIEIAYWRDAKHENPSQFSIHNIINKLSEARVLLDKLNRFKDLFDQASSILEIGGGQGWASCILKALYPQTRIYASDISGYALESVKYWERLFNVRIEGKMACRGYQIPLEAASLDLVFCFQSAHHFGAQRETLAEACRVLKEGGHCLYLHEPSCKRYIYRLAHKRVNRKRPAVPEDVLIYKDMSTFAKEAGFRETKIAFDPTLTNRGPVETVYYYLLQKFKFLCPFLPCTVDYWFVK